LVVFLQLPNLVVNPLVLACLVYLIAGLTIAGHQAYDLERYNTIISIQRDSLVGQAI
jgi:hypothetical protein